MRPAIPANSASAGLVAACGAAPTNGMGDVATALTDGEEGTTEGEMVATAVGPWGETSEEMG